jgi:hypothetical protein
MVGGSTGICGGCTACEGICMEFGVFKIGMWLLNVVKIVTVSSDIEGCQNGVVCRGVIVHIWLANCCDA